MSNTYPGAVREAISKGFLTGEFNYKDAAEATGSLEHNMQNALSSMARSGELKAHGGKHNRSYSITMTKVEPSAPEDLENLLNAMVEAEPCLRKAIKIMKLMQEVNEDG